MSEEKDYFEVIRKARRDVWNIVFYLLRKDIEVEMILHTLTISREEVEEIQTLLKGEERADLIRIAISFARDATQHGLTIEVIEEKTGVNRAYFIEYFDKGGEQNNG